MNTDDLFPIYGVILGQTTIDDIEDNAEDIDIKSEFKSASINDVCFIEIVEEGTIGYAIIGSDATFPQKWQSSLGLAWGTSCEECKGILMKKGYQIGIYTEGKHSLFGNFRSQINVLSENGEYAFQLQFGKKRAGLDLIIISKNHSCCPQCESRDIEMTTNSGLSNKYICNNCGHKWGLGYVL